MRVLAWLGGLAVLSILAARLVQPPPATVASAPVPDTQWIEIGRPHPAFALSIPEAGDAPAHYTIRRHATGGGRQDILQLGEPEGVAPYLQVEIYRPGNETSRFADPLTTIAIGAAALAPRDLTLSHESLDTKFGPLSIVPFVTGRGTERRCLGFVRGFRDPRLRISGRFCQGGEQFVARNMLSCALDRLALLAAGSEPKVGELFAQAELKRTFCGRRSPLLAPTPNHRALWAKTAQNGETGRSGPASRPDRR